MNKIIKTIQTLFLLSPAIFFAGCWDNNENSKDSLAYDSILLDPKLPPCFYVITGNNIDPKNPVYLLGTNHTLGAQDYSDEVRRKIENTQILISEFPEHTPETLCPWQRCFDRFNYVNNKFLQQDLQWFKNQFTTIGFSSTEIEDASKFIQDKWNELKDPNFQQSWFNLLTEEEQKNLEKITKEINVSLSSTHPTLLPQLLYLTGGRSNKNESLDDSYEDYLIKLFSKNNKETVYLDTCETLLWTEAVEFLYDFQNPLNISIESIKDFITNWQTEDFYYAKDIWDAERYFNALDINGLILEEIDSCTNARNIVWRDTVLKTLSSGKSASIITGAYHLKGESGFLNLLQSHGYHIQPAFINKSTQADIGRIMDFMRSIHSARTNLEPKEEPMLEKDATMMSMKAEEELLHKTI